jgi:hypothetical protein
MLSSIWAYVQDPGHRELLGWIGGGAVVLAGGLWTAFTFFAGKDKPKPEPGRSVTASNGGVAAGGDMLGNEINTRGERRERKP